VRLYPASEVPLHRLFIALCAALAAACLFAAPGLAGTCGLGSYSYAGIGSRTVVSGVAAGITSTAASTVWGGHVSGWVGVGGVGEGANGMDEWIQMGLTANPGDATSRIYYEIARPSRKTIYRELSRRVSVGEQHRFAVLEVAHEPGWWRVALAGSPVSAPVFLPGSHARWTAQVVGESAGGGTSGACNQYAFAFGNVSLASAASSTWNPIGRIQLFQDPFYRFVRSSASSFVAQSVATPARVPVSTP
jgi:hypothetical protein